MIHAKLYQDPARKTPQEKKTPQDGAVLRPWPRNTRLADEASTRVLLQSVYTINYGYMGIRGLYDVQLC